VQWYNPGQMARSMCICISICIVFSHWKKLPLKPALDIHDALEPACVRASFSATKHAQLVQRAALFPAGPSWPPVSQPSEAELFCLLCCPPFLFLPTAVHPSRRLVVFTSRKILCTRSMSYMRFFAPCAIQHSGAHGGAQPHVLAVLDLTWMVARV
jgi:hypothetical protein